MPDTFETALAERAPTDAILALDSAPAVRRLYLVVIGGVVGFLAWSALTPLAGGVVAEGRVELEASRQYVQHLEGGQVDRVLVKDGQSVKAGQLLMSLKEVQSRGAFGAADENYWGLRATQARLEREIEDGGALEWPEDLKAAVARSAVVAQKVESERRAFNVRRKQLADAEAVLGQRIDELVQQQVGANARQQAAQNQLTNVRDELNDMRSLFEKGLATRSRVSALERSAQGLDGEIGERRADVSRLSATIRETRLQIVQLRSQQRVDAASSLERVRSELSDVQGRRTQTSDILDRASVRSAVDGVVTGLSASYSGAVIRPGDALMQIVPQNEVMIVNASVRLRDIESVRAGLPAKVQFIPFPRTAPRLEGKVSYVSADALVDGQHNRSFYQARITIPASELARLGQLKLVSGMPAEVVIETRKRTVLDYLAGPALDIFSKAFREN
jgi:HlyD family type I secretion membrane fusion protein